jgi:hypothetical protein
MLHGPQTVAKQADFRAHMATYLRATPGAQQSWSAWRRVHPEFVYIDLTAGAGYLDGVAGSPMIVLKLAQELGVPLRAYFCERNARSCDILAEHLAREGMEGATCRIMRGDHADTVAEITAELSSFHALVFGHIYADPNGTPIPVEAIQTLLADRNMERLDVLAYIAATNAYKRARGAGFSGRTLAGDIYRLGKRHLVIRAPHHRQQYTFVFATNWPKAPTLKGRGFAAFDTPEGQGYLDRMEFTSAERGPWAVQPEPTPLLPYPVQRSLWEERRA